MKKALYMFFLLFVLTFQIQAQKVGLVLSGGGAKGLTHIGIIRALEENHIPIDYIAGTSMGAIVGSLYAMGYSPDDMERLLKSDSFKRWYTGNIEEKYIYYFKKNPPTPEFLNIRVSLKNPLHKVKTQFLPSSVVDPLQMNLAFLELFGQATAACNNDFNQLFVPFRCVASDVYNKRPMIFEKGDLGDAVRASMSFPAMFKPIEIDSTLVYDGGIYNNFPVNVMVNDFHPDVIIGSVVSSNPGKPQEGDIMGQLENMIMQKTDYSLPDSLGILMTFKYDNVNLMDFDRFDELHDIGYNRTIQLMDSIKARISRRINYRQLELKRIAYKKNMPELRFREISITGGNEQQKKYIRKEFHSSDHEIFSLEDLRKGYFRLMSDNMISEIIPHAVYNKVDTITRSRHVGVLATGGTIKSESYPLEIHKLFPDIKVSGEACPLWVSLVENNEAQGDGTDYFVRKYINELLAKDREIDTAILGCTHYPILLPKIRKYMPESITIVSQGKLVADSLKDYLHRHPEIDAQCTRNGKCSYYTTEAEDKFTESASIFLNEAVTVQRIEL